VLTHLVRSQSVKTFSSRLLQYIFAFPTGPRAYNGDTLGFSWKEQEKQESGLSSVVPVVAPAVPGMEMERREMAGEWGLVRWFVGREVQDTYVYEIRVLLCDVINLINIFIRSKPRNERLF
jgi:hypothetical protein